MENVIIYLIGFAGTGKFTIAKELSLKTGAHIVDNHLINNPIFSVIHTDGSTPIARAAWQKVSVIREAVYTTIEDISPRKWSFVFTNELIEGSAVDQKIFNRVASIAESRNSIFVPIRLVCDLEELYRRVESVERSSRYKLTDPKVAKSVFEHASVLKISHPLALTLEVTCLSAQESAAKIIEYINNLCLTIA
ncbi:hypothetical protein H0X48_00135 [Candidatus Dependentiae bacterium]|nr:hypothetical protein [Candidatus Dependentiae bacterium]